jgi:N-acetylmuramoyl-L-alanine amidase
MAQTRLSRLSSVNRSSPNGVKGGRKGSGIVTLRAVAAACALGVVLLARPAAMADEQGIAVRALAAPTESPAVATDVRLGGDRKQTRFVVDLNRKVDVAAFTLADPYRVVVDLPQIAFSLPSHAGEHGRGLVKAFRYGLIMQGGSRIVLDTSGPVRIENCFVLAAVDGQPARLVLNLVPTDRESFLHNIEVNARPRHFATRQSHASRHDDNDPRPLVVIDPGHGGIDSGTKSYDGKVDEKDVVLAFGLKLRKVLEKSGKYRVAMTREDDTFIPLTERVAFARQRNAALFISVHADSLPRSEGQAEGASVYTLSEHASDAEAARLAEKENKSDIIAGVDLSAEPNDVANILIDLAQRETKTFSIQFARTLASDIKRTAPLHLHPVKSAGFIVLKAPDVPSVLVELGYMTTRSDLNNLVSPEWRARTAAAMTQAVNAFFARRVIGTSMGGR